MSTRKQKRPRIDVDKKRDERSLADRRLAQQAAAQERGTMRRTKRSNDHTGTKKGAIVRRGAR
jgi:hypothetical protein